MCSRTADDNDRYGNETVHSEHQILDWADRLYLTTNLADQRKFQFWPQNPENFKPDLTVGVGAHADGSAITFLLQDNEVGGLQVLQDDQWFSVPTVPNALVINIGDQVEVIFIKASLIKLAHKWNKISEKPYSPSTRLFDMHFKMNEKRKFENNT
ncbi:2-oxoglutarate-dependent dioxygenase 11-like [Apium graveolens]|uniref:2-oxoglutarate-dependent dioxygenase 11-like n=1 Tax=Apium graveolens TaxID=4045 RepID=UPI003D7A96F1